MGIVFVGAFNRRSRSVAEGIERPYDPQIAFLYGESRNKIVSARSGFYDEAAQRLKELRLLRSLRSLAMTRGIYGTNLFVYILLTSTSVVMNPASLMNLVEETQSAGST